jgi:hypothetical protein
MGTDGRDHVKLPALTDDKDPAIGNKVKSLWVILRPSRLKPLWWLIENVGNKGPDRSTDLG